MKRKTFILTASAAVTGAAFGGFALYKLHKEKLKKRPLIYPYILSSFCDEEIFRNIGNSYRAIVPTENSSQKLLSLLTNGLKNSEISSADHSILVKQIELNVEQDFKEDKTITLLGWILSKTEARQCALFSLSL